MATLTCVTCHLKPQEVQPIASCVTCHPKRAELHLKPTHAASGCTMCHAPHQWAANKRESCSTCHPDKTNHYPQGLCSDCHPFRQAKAS
jgi:hypothetical protein